MPALLVGQPLGQIPFGDLDVEIVLARLALTRAAHQGVSDVDTSAVIGCEGRLR